MPISPEYQLFKFGVLHLEWPTALYVLCIFLITLFFLNAFLFRPMLKSLHSRGDELKSHVDSAQELEGRLQSMHEEQRTSARKSHERLSNYRITAITEAKDEAARLLAQAQEESRSKLDAISAELEAEVGAIRSNAQTTVQELSELIVKRVVASKL